MVGFEIKAAGFDSIGSRYFVNSSLIVVKIF